MTEKFIIEGEISTFSGYEERGIQISDLELFYPAGSVESVGYLYPNDFQSFIEHYGLENKKIRMIIEVLK